MKKSIFLFVALLFPAITLFAQDGLTCETAIPVDKTYSGSVPEAGTYYYLVSTYNLPLTCYFYPDEKGANAPDVAVDFTCTPGYYEDPLLAEMIQSASGWGIETPIKFWCNYGVDEYDREYYYLSINESYREIMATFDIIDDITAIVEVTTYCAGEVRLSPDTTFKSCVENSHWIELADTITTGIGREEDSYVLPLVKWQNDSIRFRWTGSEPVTVWLGGTCEFKFQTTGENSALDMFVLYPDAGNEENIRNYNKQDIYNTIKQFGKGGVYYLRAVSSEDAELIVEAKPMNEIMQKVIPLSLDQSVEVLAKDTEQVYFFPTSWEDNNILWLSSSPKAVTAYFSVLPEFAADESDAYVLDTYTFTTASEGRELGLSKKQINALCDYAIDDHVYVKFVSSEATTITPVLWSASACIERADEIFVNDDVTLSRNASSTAWRINIEQWAKQDVKLFWKGNSDIKIYLCDTCAGFTLSTTNKHVKYYKEVKLKTDGTRDTLNITKDELQELAQYADADGYLYFRFNNRAAGTLAVVPGANATPTNDCVESSTKLTAGETLTINLKSAFTVYCIKYEDWKESGMTLTWTGTEPLHTFVAETCEFALAPYNKYVHAYVPVRAEEDMVVDMEALAGYVDEAGYLYIRFLTEFEGELTIK